MKCCGQLLLSVLFVSVSATAQAEAVFNVWIDAPSVVQAGETFSVSFWGEVSGSVLTEGDGAMRTVQADVFATGVDANISTAVFPHMVGFVAGEPEPNALRNVLGLNDYYLFSPNFWVLNPVELFSVEVTTSVQATGELELTAAPASWQDNLLTWWVDWRDAEFVSDTDPGSSRIITPATVRVVPSSGGVAVLAVAGLAAVRRRR